MLYLDMLLFYDTAPFNLFLFAMPIRVQALLQISVYEKSYIYICCRNLPFLPFLFFFFLLGKYPFAIQFYNPYFGITITFLLATNSFDGEVYHGYFGRVFIEEFISGNILLFGALLVENCLFVLIFFFLDRAN